MKAKITLIILFLSFFLNNSFSNDTIRYELLKLEKIQVDTLIKNDAENFVGCVNLQFRKGVDTLINFSFISIMGYKNPRVIYYWIKQKSRANFTLTIGLHYKLQLIPQCKEDLDEDNFYSKYSDFTKDNCYLSRIFNVENYQNNFDVKLSNYGHINSKVYKVFRFYPTFANEIKDSGYRLDFIPIDLRIKK